MTHSKITETEFKEWSQQLKTIFTELFMSPNVQFSNEDDKQDFMKLGFTISIYASEGVFEAVLLGMISLESIKLNSDVPLIALDGLTFREWEEKVYNKIKEHCVATGYYNPSSPTDLSSLKERNQKVDKILKDKEEVGKLLFYGDDEEYKYISNLVSFYRALEEIFPGTTGKSHEDDIPQGLDFFVENRAKRVEKLISKKEEAEKNKPTSNSLAFEPAPEYKNNLENETKRLQEKIKELEGKINNTDNSIQEEVYQKMLNNAKKILADKQKERDKLKGNPNQKSTSPNDNSNKLNWAIGLGIVAALIGLICLILIVNRRKEK